MAFGALEGKNGQKSLKSFRRRHLDTAISCRKSFWIGEGAAKTFNAKERQPVFLLEDILVGVAL